MEPKIIRPFSDTMFNDIQTHVREVRRLVDWPGIPYHDEHLDKEHKMNRWFWNNQPLLKMIHNSLAFRKLADLAFDEPLQSSYVFTSLYGPSGVVPLHTDRPQCYRTIDLQIDSDGSWPIYVNDKAYVLKAGEALCYSGTGDKHYRKPMSEDSKNYSDEGPATFMNLAFFHFVPADWMGDLK